MGNPLRDIANKFMAKEDTDITAATGRLNDVDERILAQQAHIKEVAFQAALSAGDTAALTAANGELASLQAIRAACVQMLADAQKAKQDRENAKALENARRQQNAYAKKEAQLVKTAKLLEAAHRNAAQLEDEFRELSAEALRMFPPIKPNNDGDDRALETLGYFNQVRLINRSVLLHGLKGQGQSDQSGLYSSVAVTSMDKDARALAIGSAGHEDMLHAGEVKPLSEQVGIMPVPASQPAL